MSEYDEIVRDILTKPSSERSDYAREYFQNWLGAEFDYENNTWIPVFLFRFIEMRYWKELFFSGLRLILDPFETCGCPIYDEADWDSEDEDDDSHSMDSDYFPKMHCTTCDRSRYQYRKLHISPEAQEVLEEVWQKWFSSQFKMSVSKAMALDRLGLVPDLINQVLENQVTNTSLGTSVLKEAEDKIRRLPVPDFEPYDGN